MELALRIIDRFCVAVVAGAGLCGAALALSPGAVATPFATGGGANCLETQAGFGAAPIAGAPVVLPGPIPLAPVVPVVPPVPPIVPPVPPIVPPIPPVFPVVPVAGGAPIAGGLGAAAPITMAAGTGKGAPIATASAPPAAPVVLPGPVLPGPAEAVAAEVPSAPIPAVLAGTTSAVPACGAALSPAQ